MGGDMGLKSGQKVTRTRRLFAAGIDLLVVGVASVIMFFFVNFSHWENPNPVNYPLIFGVGMGFTFFYAILDAFWFGTVAKCILGIRIVIEKPGKTQGHLIRFVAKWVPLFVIFDFPSLAAFPGDGLKWVALAWGWAAGLACILNWFNLILILFDFKPFHDRVSGARLEQVGIEEKRPVEPRGFEVIMKEKD